MGPKSQRMMTRMAVQELTAPQRALVETWERHMAAEFDTKSIEATMATMTADPVVNHVPVMTGGVGARDVRHLNTVPEPFTLGATPARGSEAG